MIVNRLDKAIGTAPDKEDLLVLALTKGPERYIFLYHPGSEREVRRVLRRFAKNKQLRFTREDAARLAQQLKETW